MYMYEVYFMMDVVYMYFFDDQEAIYFYIDAYVLIHVLVIVLYVMPMWMQWII